MKKIIVILEGHGERFLCRWDQEAIHLAQGWTSKENGILFYLNYCYFDILFYWVLLVLEVTDAKISFDEYRQRVTSTYSSKTVIITNPGQLTLTISFCCFCIFFLLDTRRAHALFRFAQSVEIPDDEEEETSRSFQTSFKEKDVDCMK